MSIYTQQIKEITVVYEAEEQVIKSALILIYDNRNTSASKSGLERRAAHLVKIEEMLRDLIGLTEDELDTMYWEWIAVQGR